MVAVRPSQPTITSVRHRAGLCCQLVLQRGRGALQHFGGAVENAERRKWLRLTSDGRRASQRVGVLGHRQLIAPDLPRALQGASPLTRSALPCDRDLDSKGRAVVVAAVSAQVDQALPFNHGREPLDGSHRRRVQKVVDLVRQEQPLGCRARIVESAVTDGRCNGKIAGDVSC